MSNTVTRLISPELRQKHQRLVNALGSENNPAQWMVFMSACEDLIPEIMQQGRPSAKAVQFSMIGQLGFSSWKEMIETPVDQNGLGWKWEGWRSFRRAWSVVKEHNYLLDMDLKAGWINSALAGMKRNGDEFPKTKQEFYDYQQKSEDRAKERKENSVVALKQQIVDLNARINQLKQDLAKQSGISEITAKNNSDLNAKVSELTQLLALAEKRSQQPKIKAQPKLSRWQHFIALFTGK